ncbi:MAG: hypothetical protein AAGF81_06565, partial [Pseudomonadota bacterium]
MAGWQDDILSRLEKYTGYEVSHDDISLSVCCDNPESVEVSVWETGSSFQVGIGGWHEHFDALEDALNCFAFGLSEACRLKVTLRGSMECAWTMQSLEDGEWVDDTTTGLLFIP